MPNRQYLITHRRTSALSQDEVAALAGLSRQAISHYENQVMLPSFESAIRLEIIFGQRPGYLFPVLYEQAEEAVMQAAAALRQALEGKKDTNSRRKIDVLDGMMRRATITAPV